jgi:hypothetical protein
VDVASAWRRYRCNVRIASILAVIMAVQQQLRRMVAVTVERLSSNISSIDGDNRSSCDNTVVPDNEQEPNGKEAANKVSGQSLTPATPTVQKYVVFLRTTGHNIESSKTSYSNTHTLVRPVTLVGQPLDRQGRAK